MPIRVAELTKKAFVERMRGAISSTLGPTSPLQCSLPARVQQLVTAHAAYESGWGTAKAALLGLNYWNLTSGTIWKGPVIVSGDTEFVAGAANVKPKPITQRFRKYESDSAAVQDYFTFLMAGRYKDAQAKLMNGDASFVEDLGLYTYSADGKTLVLAWGLGVAKGGFYTLPIPRYTVEFNAVLKQVEQLGS